MEIKIWGVRGYYTALLSVSDSKDMVDKIEKIGKENSDEYDYILALSPISGKDGKVLAIYDGFSRRYNILEDSFEFLIGPKNKRFNSIVSNLNNRKILNIEV